MIGMMGLQMQQDFVMCQDKMKQERKRCHQELAMQQQMLQSQQQMMNIFMMTMMGQKHLPDSDKKYCNNHNDIEDNN